MATGVQVAQVQGSAKLCDVGPFVASNPRLRSILQRCGLPQSCGLSSIGEWHTCVGSEGWCLQDAPAS